MMHEMRRIMTLVEAEDPRRVFRMGLCDVMAVALHQATHLPLGLWRGFFPDDDGEPGDEAYEDCHAVVVLSLKPPRWIDVDGVHDGLPKNCHFNQPVERVDLIAASEDEVMAAFTAEEFEPEYLAQASAFVTADPTLSALVKQYGKR